MAVVPFYTLLPQEITIVKMLYQLMFIIASNYIK